MLSTQIIWLFILALPIACIAWTVTQEAIFLELRNYCIKQSKENKHFFLRKCFYLLTCEYCFSHYVTLFFLMVTRYTLLLPGWRGYLIAGFSLVWIANIYMSAFGLIRQAIKEEKTKIALEEKEIRDNKINNSSGKLFNGKRKSMAPPSIKNPDYWKDI